MGELDVWYSHISPEDILAAATTRGHAQANRPAVAKARTQDSLQAFPKLAGYRGRQPRHRRPSAALIHVEAANIRWTSRISSSGSTRVLFRTTPARSSSVRARGPSPQGRRRRQRRHALLHRAHGRAGRRRPAVPPGEGGAELGAGAALPKSRYRNHGQRVVAGQRLMQASSDIFLGWTEGRRSALLLAAAPRHEGLVRRREHGARRPSSRMRASAVGPRTRPRASGDADAIAAISARATVREAVADFSESYADQAERDHQTMLDAISEGQDQG